VVSHWKGCAGLWTLKIAVWNFPDRRSLMNVKQGMATNFNLTMHSCILFDVLVSGEKAIYRQ